MPRFQKTRLHWSAAVLGLVGIYALGGMAYAASVHSRDSVTIWIVVAVLAFVGAFGVQRFIASHRRRGAAAASSLDVFDAARDEREH